MDYDDGEDQGSKPEATNTSELAALQTKLKEFEDDNYKLREKIRRTEFVSEYGEEIAELVPTGLKPEEAKELADKLAARLKPSEQPDQTGNTEPEATPDADEPSALAAVAKGPAPGSAAAPVGAELSAKELGQLAQEDPAAFSAAIAAKYRDG